MNKYGIVFCIFLLSACHVGEEYQVQSPLSDKDIEAILKVSSREKQIATDWYIIFKDDVLNTLLEDTLNHNFSIKEAEERLLQARYMFQIQSKTFLPFVNAQGEYLFSKANSEKNIIDKANQFKLGFDATWEIDFWGKGFYLTQQYEELLGEKEYSLLNVKAVISAEIVDTYVMLRKSQEKLNIAEKNLRLQYETLKTVQDKHSAGIVDDLALNQAEYVVETTKALIPGIKTDIETSKNAIAVLAGKPLNKLAVNLDKYKKNIVADTFKYSVQNLYNLPLNTLSTRPDIMMAQKNIDVQNAVVNQAIAELYPSISLEATFGYVSLSGHHLFDNNSQIYGYNPALSVPIWNWKQLQNNIELQKHKRNEYVLVYNEALLTALSELKNAVVSVNQAYEKNRFMKNSLFKMKNIMLLTKEKYQNGLVDFTDVANAERDLLDTQTAYVESNAEILHYLTAFYKATGGGYNFR